MYRALELAEEAYRCGEVPVGAVLAARGGIVCGERNRREELGDATAHAEMLVLREAGRILGGWRLLDTTLYVTLEPCPMCAGALVLARIPRLVFGARDPKGGAVVSLYSITTDPRLNHRLEVVEGVLQESCAKLLKRFFRHKRNGRI